MKLLVMSDVHGNLSALDAVLDCGVSYGAEACVLVGDLIDYGMRSNETVARVQGLSLPVLCNIYGNHEDAIINGWYERFSSNRGRDCARYTRSVLTPQTIGYIENNMQADGVCTFAVGDKKCLAVHGKLGEPYWKSLTPDDDMQAYAAYDYVFTGHSHLPHFFERYYEADNPKTRYKKKTVFINPGSVGQPRNLNNRAQFVLLDTDSEEIRFEKVAYDIDGEQKLYDGQVDDFYRDRLKYGV